MISHFWPRPNPACDLSQFPTDLHRFTPEQREAMVQLLSEQPVWWLKEKRASIPHLGEKSVQRMAKDVVDDAIARAMRGNPIPASEIEYTKRSTRKEFSTASVPQIRARLAELNENVLGRLSNREIFVEYKRAEEEALAGLLREKLAKDRDLNSTRHNPRLPKIGSKFTVPRPRKPFQITVTNVTAKSVIGKDSRGKKWRVPLSYRDERTAHGAFESSRKTITKKVRTLRSKSWIVRVFPRRTDFLTVLSYGGTHPEDTYHDRRIHNRRFKSMAAAVSASNKFFKLMAVHDKEHRAEVRKRAQAQLDDPSTMWPGLSENAEYMKGLRRMARTGR